MPSEKTVERMKKIKRQAESAGKIGSEEEAQSFAELLQKLLAEHKMSLSDIEDAEDQREPCITIYFRPENHNIEIKSQTVAPPWISALARMLGESHATAVAVVKECNWILLHGKRRDAELCEQSLGYLGRAAMLLAMRSYRETFKLAKSLGLPHITKDYKSSFLLGFVVRIKQRLDESRVKLESSTGLGLMRLDRDLVLASESLDKECELEQVEAPKQDDINNYAYMKGQEQADLQQLRPTGELDA